MFHNLAVTAAAKHNTREREQSALISQILTLDRTHRLDALSLPSAGINVFLSKNGWKNQLCGLQSQEINEQQG